MPAAQPTSDLPASDVEFIAALRQAVEEFFRAVDEWETAYRKYYRLADPAGRPSSDLDPQQRVYDAAHARLSSMFGRARGLCFRYGIREPWSGLLHSKLGQFAPQDRHSSAVSRTERALAFETVILLAEKCGSPGATPEPSEPDLRSPLRRLRDFFF
jgi:hypothetical protein